MGNSKHTPGPYGVFTDSEKAGMHPNHKVRFVCTADFDEDAGRGQVLAKLTDSPEIVGNGLLFSAAPDLLACVHNLVKKLADHHGVSVAEYMEEAAAGREAAAAISKAGATP